MFNHTKTSPVRQSVPRRVKLPHSLRQARRRRQRCDCGRLAVKVLFVKVGSDPQYSVSLPLCSECLSVEKGMHDEANR